MPNDPFNSPYAQRMNLPGGLPTNLLVGYMMNQSSQAGYLNNPLYIGNNTAFDAYRGYNYDQRQMNALGAAFETDRQFMHAMGTGLTNLAGHEYTPEVKQAMDFTMSLGAPMFMDLMRQSPGARRAASAMFGGTHRGLIGLGMEGISRRMSDPISGRIGMDLGSSNAIADQVHAMLQAGPRMSTPDAGQQGVMLNRGMSYGFSEIDTMHAMASMAREGALPSGGAAISAMADPSLREAIARGDIHPSDYMLGQPLTDKQKMLIKQGRAQESDFYSGVGQDVLAMMQDFNVTDPASFAAFEQQLADPSSQASKRMQQVNAKEVAEAASSRLASLEAVMEFLTDDEIQELQDDLASVSSQMLQQLSGNAVHQISSTQLQRNLREMKFAADRLGLSREQVQAMAGVAASDVARYGFENADTGDFIRDQMASLQQFNDTGMGSFAAKGIASYGMASQEEMAQQNARGLAGVRRSRNARMTAALSVLESRAGVSLTEGGAAARLLAEARSGQFSEASQQLLSGTNEQIIEQLIASSQGLTREDIINTYGQDFVLQEALNSDPNLVEANRQVAAGDVFRNKVARGIAMGSRASLQGVGGGAESKEQLSRLFGSAIAADLKKRGADDASDTQAKGKLVGLQLQTAREAIEAAAAGGNEAAISIMNMSEEDRDNLLRNMTSAGYDATKQAMRAPIAETVARYGDVGNNARMSAAAYQKGMAELAGFSAGDKQSPAARAAAVVLGAAQVEGASLSDFMKVVGFDPTGEDTMAKLQELRNKAMVEMDAIDEQLKTLDPSSQAPLRAEKDMYQRAVDKIGKFIEDGPNKDAVSEEDRKRIEEYLKTGVIPTDGDAAVGADGKLTAGGAVAGSGSARIDNATIDNVSMGPVTITLGDTVIQTNSATVSNDRGPRSTVSIS